MEDFSYDIILKEVVNWKSFTVEDGKLFILGARRTDHLWVSETRLHLFDGKKWSIK